MQEDSSHKKLNNTLDNKKNKIQKCEQDIENNKFLMVIFEELCNRKINIKG